MSATSIFIVEHGDYEDYSVAGIYSTREKAQAVADWFNGTGLHDMATVDERTLDLCAAEIADGQFPFYIVMGHDGVVMERETETNRRCLIAHDLHLIKWQTDGITRLSGLIFARSFEHAIELSNTKRLALIDAGEWK